MMKLVKLIGQPFCILLYVIGAIMAFNKKLIPLIVLFCMHLSEYFIIGKRTGEEYGYTKLQALARCLLFGFTWWLPVRKSDE